mmetsp:Transcript_12940/g.19467  ORF Transcript_12940/g.19467 Transcript_12940/m.19467 type:complete len:255 (+) Transcript_12940:91-855(+)|eukprot:CAMPEP_0185025174 /NCGR_PEP_ID=MMETSP1103-20130426/8238_1 /TAXON_ID=36769 /ORGANISM="Paraphysomonas bandaiensis, Strain Caron Lab Isolate" /LENGTH=254 /DNA_ID=CAMNT_0027558323 /DNA_START=81 /DNA_END=845 /DNA_ORIENTATION=-
MSESIYNLVPREYVEPPKPPMHRSQHDPASNLTGSTFGCFGSTRLPGAGVVDKREGALFGPHKSLAPHKSTTKRLQRAGSNSLSSSGERKCEGPKKPAIPSKSERPVMGINSNKNYITANAVEAILMVPKNTVQPELNYLEKEDYGKVPEYLTHVKEEVRRENEMIDQYINEQMGTTAQEPDKYEELSEEEREELIYQLKLKWNEVNTKYQKITHLVRLDTLGQLRRKEQMEAQLKQLESDIERISRAGPVLIS